MPNCPSCGQPVTESAVFCSQCGHRLGTFPSEPADSTPREVTMWTPAPPGLDETRVEPEKEASPPPRRPGLGCYLGAAVAALGSIIALGGLTLGLVALTGSGPLTNRQPGAGISSDTVTPVPAIAIAGTPSAEPDTEVPPSPTTTPAPDPTETPTVPLPTLTSSPEPTGTPAPTQTPAPTVPALTGDQYLDEATIWDDFSSDALGWSQKADDDIGRVYMDGAYVIYDNVGMYVASDVPVDFTPTGIEFEAQVGPGIEDGEYGVICHYQDDANWDAVAIHPLKGSFHVAQLIDDEYVNVTDPLWQAAPAIDTDRNAVNRVLIECLDDEIGLFINDTLIGRWTLPTPREPRGMALYVYGYRKADEPYQVIFDNVYAWIPVQ